MNETTTTEPQIIILDGIKVDAETGEMIGVADHRDDLFKFTDEDAEIVLRRISRHQAEALEHVNNVEYLEAKAKVQNTERMATRSKKKAEAIEAYYAPFMLAYAKDKTAGKLKGRFVDSLHGRIQLREVPLAYESISEGDTIRWAKTVCPSAVRESLLVSEISDDLREEASKGDKPIFRRVDAHDTVTVKTGIGVKK